MKFEMTVPEVSDLIKEIQQRPEDLFEMIRASVKEIVIRSWPSSALRWKCTGDQTL